MLYNTSLNIDYKNEKYNSQQKHEMFQNQFLKAFYIEIYDEKIVIKKLDQIYNDISNDNNMKKLFNEIKKKNKIFPFDLSDKDMFSLLFSYDTFDLIHLYSVEGDAVLFATLLPRKHSDIDGCILCSLISWFTIINNAITVSTMSITICSYFIF